MENQKEVTTTQNDQEEVAQEPQSDVDPWSAFKRQFSGVALLKDARRLRDLRSEAKSERAELEEVMAELGEDVEQATDPLDRLALTEEIQEMQDRIEFCEAKLEAIDKRVETLLAEAESKKDSSDDAQTSEDIQ